MSSDLKNDTYVDTLVVGLVLYLTRVVGTFRGIQKTSVMNVGVSVGNITGEICI